MRITDTSDLWWKTAVIYCLDVETFLDWDGDGIGDFAGSRSGIDYLAELGVTCLWLMPFYPTPDRDDGYDITDFYGVDPRLGTLGDFVELIRTARDRGMRVIVDLVVNHTSDQHPWFQAARASRDVAVTATGTCGATSRRRRQAEIVFPDQENERLGVRRAGRPVLPAPLLPHQPDLNIANPRCATRSPRCIGFWLQLGSPGSGSTPCRSSSRPPACRTPRPRCPTRTSYLRDLRAFLSRRTGRRRAARRGQPAVRATSWSSSAARTATSCTMHVRLHRHAAAVPVARPRRRRARSPRRCSAPAAAPAASASGRRSSATTTSSRSTSSRDAERQEVFDAFGPRPRCRSTAGAAPAPAADARRRPAPHPHGLQPAVLPARAPRCSSTARRSAWARTSSAEGRHAVRTPMQWTTARTAASPTRRRRAWPAPLPEGGYGAGARQRRPPAARPRLAAATSSGGSSSATASAPSSAGALRGARPAAPAVLAHRCTWDDGSIVALHNPRRTGAVPCTLADRRRARCSSTCWGTAPSSPTRGAGSELPLEGVRLPLAAGHASRFPAPPVTTRWPPR